MATEGTGDVATSPMALLTNHQDTLASLVAEMWNGWYHSNTRQTWRNEVDEVKRFLYATDTNATSNRANPMSHNTHRPKLAELADNLEANYMAALFPHDQWNQFIPADQDANKVRIKRLVEAYIDSRHRIYGHRATMNTLIRDWIEEGNAFVEVLWQAETAGVEDLITNGYVGPKIRRLDPRRVAFNNSASSFQDSWKIVQSVKTMGDIASDIQDEKLSEEYREVLTKVRDFRNHARGFAEDIDQDWLDAPYSGFGNNNTYFCMGDKVELLTFYGTIYDNDNQELHTNRKITVVDRKWVLLDEEIDTDNGKPYIFHSPWRQPPNSILGMGPLQNITGMQYMINHLYNRKADAFDKMASPDYLIRMIEDVEQRADGSKWFYSHDSQGSVTVVSPDTTILNADFQIQELERKMEEYAGAPREAIGLRTPGEKTKFEVQQSSSRADRRFEARTAQFTNQLIEPATNAELQLARKKVDSNLQILTTTEMGDIFEEISKSTLQNQGVLVAVGARHYAQQARLVQELQGFLQTAQADPAILEHFPPRKIAQAFNSLLGGFGSHEGLYEEWGRVAEAVEAQQQQQAAASVVDQSAIAQESLSNPETLGLEPL